MQLEHARPVIAAAWVTLAGIVGLSVGVTSATGLLLLGSLAVLPPLAMLLLWTERPRSMSETIRDAIR
jgi:hypothetical protein